MSDNQNIERNEERTYIISSCNNIKEVKADAKIARQVIDMFCTVTAQKEYDSSSLLKVENYQISEDLFCKVLQKTLQPNDISLTNEQEKTLEPYSHRLRSLSIETQ